MSDELITKEIIKLIDIELNTIRKCILSSNGSLTTNYFQGKFDALSELKDRINNESNVRTVKVFKNNWRNYNEY